MGRFYDLTDRRFGRLTVLERCAEDYDPPCGIKVPRWLCVCDCGVECAVISRSLLTGRTRSCGCLRQENAREQARRRQK